MRAPERIPMILEKLHTLWQQQPDATFGQLIFNLYWKIPETRRTKEGAINFFNVEDAVFESILDRELEKKSNS